MNLLQVRVDDNLKKAIDKKANTYGVPASSLVRIVLVKMFLGEKKHHKNAPGNVYNADRDTQGRGIALDDLIAVL